jgi:predicted Zn finger-like uncharacterized protein
MLIVCPSCATSYMIDQASFGPAGRTVRCARCKVTWVAGEPKSTPDVTAFVDSVIADAGAQSTPLARTEAAPPPTAAAPPAPSAQAAAADVGAEDSESITATDSKAPPVEPPPPEPAPAETPATETAEALAPEPEPAMIADAPSLVPPIEHEPLPDAANAEPDSEDAESLDARRQRLQGRRKQSLRSSRWTAIILVLVACNVALLGARKDVVRYLPQTASLFAAIGLPVNLRNLKFENVRISKEAEDSINNLIVEGAIVSEAGKPVEVPRLRFAARNSTGQEAYTWTMPPPRSILGPGERLEFRSQIPAPPADASDVMVRFFTAQDAAAGVK